MDSYILRFEQCGQILGYNEDQVLEMHMDTSQSV